jgi:hypothetical protein
MTAAKIVAHRGDGVIVGQSADDLVRLPGRLEDYALETLTAADVAPVFGLASGALGRLRLDGLAAGVDTLGAVELRRALSTASGLDLPATLAFDYPTLAELGDAVVGMMREAEEEQEGEEEGGGGGDESGVGVGKEGGHLGEEALPVHVPTPSLPSSSVPSSSSFSAPSSSSRPSAPPAPPTNPLAPTLSAAAVAQGYFTSPPLRRLARAPDAALASVPRFTVGKAGVGEVLWLGPVNVKGLGDLDRVVEFAHGRVSVYAAGRGGGGGGGSGRGGGAEEETNAAAAADGKGRPPPLLSTPVPRPPRGQGLNAPAILTLRNIRPKRKNGESRGGGMVAGGIAGGGLASSASSSLSSAAATTTATPPPPPPSSSSFEAKIRATAERAGWTHVDYDAERGVWVVKVAGF